MLRYLVDIDIRYLRELGRHLVRVFRCIRDHVVLVGIRSNARSRSILVLEVVVTERHFVIRLQPPRPQVALQLAGFGVHQRFDEALRITLVAPATGFVGDPDAARIRIKYGRTTGRREHFRRTAVGILLAGGARFTAVTNDATARVIIRYCHRLNRKHHRAVRELFDTLVAGLAALLICQSQRHRIETGQRRFSQAQKKERNKNSTDHGCHLRNGNYCSFP